MHLATLVCFCVSAVSAVKHYGLTPTKDVMNLVEGHAQTLSATHNLTALFTSNDHNSHDGADFLAAELGIFNKTIAEAFPSPSFSHGDRSLQPRNPVKGQCQGHGKIEDKLSSAQITVLCASIAGVSAGGVHTVIGVIESKACIEAGTGHPLPPCKSIFSFIDVAGVVFTSTTVNSFCPSFLSFFVSCNGANAKATARNNSDFEMTGFNTQKDYNCKGAAKDDKCFEKSV